MHVVKLFIVNGCVMCIYILYTTKSRVHKYIRIFLYRIYYIINGHSLKRNQSQNNFYCRRINVNRQIYLYFFNRRFNSRLAEAQPKVGEKSLTGENDNLLIYIYTFNISRYS